MSIVWQDLTQDDLKDENLLVVNANLRRLANEVNRLGGSFGPIRLAAPLDMQGNRISNLGAPQSATDALHQNAADPLYGASVQQANMEATGTKMLQSVRRLGDASQRETNSTFLNNQASLNAQCENNFSWDAPVPSTGGDAVINWSWSQFTVFFADGSQYVVPTSATPITFTQLQASTKYYFLIYFDMINKQVAVTLSQQGGGLSPASIDQTMTANFDGNVVIAVNAVATTAAVGGASGGGGGGTSYCPSVEQVIMTREDGLVPAGMLRRHHHHVPDLEDGVWNDVLWTEVVEGEIVPIKIGDTWYSVEINHLWMLHDDPEKWIRTCDCSLGTMLRNAAGGVIPVRAVGEPHWGLFVRLRVERGRLRIGDAIGHNFYTS